MIAMRVKRMAFKFKFLVIMESRHSNIFKEEKVKDRLKNSSFQNSYEPMTDAELAKALNLDIVELKEYENPDDELYGEMMRNAIESYAYKLADRHGDFYAPADESENNETEMPGDHGIYQLDDCGKPPNDQESSQISGNDNDLFLRRSFIPWILTDFN